MKKRNLLFITKNSLISIFDILINCWVFHKNAGCPKQLPKFGAYLGTQGPIIPHDNNTLNLNNISVSHRPPTLPLSLRVAVQ